MVRRVKLALLAGDQNWSLLFNQGKAKIGPLERLILEGRGIDGLGLMIH